MTVTLENILISVEYLQHICRRDAHARQDLSQLNSHTLEALIAVFIGYSYLNTTFTLIAVAHSGCGALKRGDDALNGLRHRQAEQDVVDVVKLHLPARHVGVGRVP